MPDVLVDTDVVIDHLRGVRRLDAVGDQLHYSTITRAELFAGPAREEEAVKSLLAPFREVEVTRPIAEAAGRIKRTLGVAMPDALIAATALAEDLELLTRNIKDFAGIDGLRVREP
jgi:predicted nucleic acid-binding protein